MNLQPEVAQFARTRAAILCAILVLLAPGCASKGGSKTETTAQTSEATVSTAPDKEPDHIKVQHMARHTDDSAPGIYGLANRGVTPAGPPSEYGRDQMVPAFGNVGFKLKLGEIGVADYDARTSPYGYHVIKRVQ